jgi:hypothetical protein
VQLWLVLHAHSTDVAANSGWIGGEAADDHPLLNERMETRDTSSARPWTQSVAAVPLRPRLASVVSDEAVQRKLDEVDATGVPR